MFAFLQKKFKKYYFYLWILCVTLLHGVSLYVFQCTRPCDSGVQTRSVKCMGPDNQESAACPSSSKPLDSQDCNTFRCQKQPGIPQSPGFSNFNLQSPWFFQTYLTWSIGVYLHLTVWNKPQTVLKSMSNCTIQFQMTLKHIF